MGFSGEVRAGIQPVSRWGETKMVAALALKREVFLPTWGGTSASASPATSKTQEVSLNVLVIQ